MIRRKKRSKLFAVIGVALLAAACSVAAGFDVKDAKSATKLTGAGPVCGGWQLFARLAKPTVAVGDEVVLKLTLQNVSKKNMTFPGGSPRSEFKLTVTDARGRGARGNANLYPDPAHDGGWVIDPGGEVLEEYRVNSVFGDDISKPGQYHITARYPDPYSKDSAIVYSNNVVLTVVKPRAARSKGSKNG